MTPGNRKHLKKVLIWGGGLSALGAALSLLKFPPLVAASVIMGAALGIFNVYSIIKLVEALAGAAVSGPAPGQASRVMSTLMHVVKLVVIFAVLLMLVIYKLTNLIALAAGFTVVLIANMAAGLGGFKEDAS
jgi:hypothetical protein